jgi:HEAT repeat protein
VNYRSQREVQIVPRSSKSTGAGQHEVKDTMDLTLLPALERWLQAFLEADFQARWELSKQIGPFGNQVILPLLSWLQRDETDWEIKWFAIRLLSGFNTAGVICAIATFMVTTDDSDLQASAAQALSDMGDKAIAPLTELLSHRDQRKIAVQTLAHIRQRPVIEPLLSVIHDIDPHIRYLAIEALGSFHDERVTPVLLAALKDTHSDVRSEVAHILGRRRDLRESQQLIAQLEPALWDINPNVCTAAASAIGRLGGEGSEAALYRVLQSAHTPEALKLETARALSWIDTPLAVECLCNSLECSTLPVRYEIIQALGQIQTPALQAQAIRTLMQWLKAENLPHRDSHLKQALALAVGTLQATEAVPVLQQWLKDPDPRVSCHALAALKKITPDDGLLRHDSSHSI